MLTIMLIEQKPEVIDVVQKFLEQNFRADVKVFFELEPSKKYLKDNLEMGRPQLVIVRKVLDDVEVAKGILNFIYDNEEKVPVIVMGELEFSTAIEFDVLPDRFKVSELNKLVIKNLNLSREDLQILKRPPFVGISIKDFYILEKSLCDIYIKIVKKGAEDQYVKRLYQGDNFEMENLKKYESMGLKEFFIKSEDLPVVMSEIERRTLAQLDHDFSPEELISIGESSFEIGQDLLSKLGVSEMTLKIVDANIKSMTSAITSTVSGGAGVGTLLKSVLSSKGSFIYKHSFLISLFSSTLVPKMEWGQNDQLKANIEKLVYVSFLHDLLLDNDKLIKIHSREEFIRANLTDVEKELVSMHANKISTMALSMPRTPTGIDVILKQHHGTTNGVGFPEGPNSSLSALAILFIVVEYFVHCLFDFKNLQLGPRGILKKMETVFDLPSYRKVILAMSDMITRASK